MQIDRKRLETKNLILDAAQFSDWEALYRNLWSHEESARYMLWTVTGSEEEARERMRRTTAYQQEHPLAWTVFEKAEGRAIGFAGLEEIAEGVYEDTGIAVGPAFVRRGYGRQIVTALLEYSFHELGAKRFVYSCRANNAASRALALACGFCYTHSEDRTDRRNGEAYVLEFYQISRVSAGGFQGDGS